MMQRALVILLILRANLAAHSSFFCKHVRLACDVVERFKCWHSSKCAALADAISEVRVDGGGGWWWRSLVW